MTWEDESRNGMIETSILDLGRCGRLVVHHYLGYGDTWFASFYGFGRINKRGLAAITLDEAKREALAITNQEVAMLSAILKQVTP